MSEHETQGQPPVTPPSQESLSPPPPPPSAPPTPEPWSGRAAPDPYSGQPYGAQPHSGQPYPSQPYSAPPGYPTSAGPWSPSGAPSGPAPGEPRRRSRMGLAVTGVALLAALAAAGGGIAGAALYAQTQDDGNGGSAGTTQVVDAPQLEYTSLASIASQVSPSVVSIRIGDFGGSGVVMSEDGYIVTNAHVVDAAPGSDVRVRFSNGETAPAAVVGSDARSDIAVIRAEGVSGLTPASFGDSGAALVGDTVLAIGSPLGFDGSVTQGIVSALDRTLSPDQQGGSSLSGLLQIDAAINSGNSGGALVNLAGEVIGINTAIAIQNQDDGFLGVGFAVPSNRATDVAQQLIDGEEVDHAFLGVSVAPADTGGAVIGDVVPGSPADEAGLQEGDVVVRIGDRPITDSNDLVSAVQSASVGDTLEVEFQRDGAAQTTTVTLAEAD